MKTSKKGFTLIELIVVIAIIGVLAAILVPSMLGYVKKSKIQGANSTASTLAKAANSAAADLDEDDSMFDDGYVTLKKGTKAKTTADTSAKSGVTKVKAEDEVKAAIKPFFSDIETIDACVGFKDGSCTVAAVRSGKYYGTYPSYYTAKNWDTKEVAAPKDAKEACEAVVKAGKAEVGGTTTTT